MSPDNSVENLERDVKVDELVSLASQIGPSLFERRHKAASDRSLPKKTISATLECAGNNRGDLTPSVPGNQFSNGAVSNAIWSGVSLRDVLNLVNLNDSVLQILLSVPPCIFSLPLAAIVILFVSNVLA